jgi:hypothetical protein
MKDFIQMLEDAFPVLESHPARSAGYFPSLDFVLRGLPSESPSRPNLLLAPF